MNPTIEKEYDVFISYSRKDYVDECSGEIIPNNIVSQIKNVLENANFSYWFDEKGIYSGDAWAPLLAKAIKASKVFLFVSSENANKSPWTSSEIATAHMYKKKIIPFRYDNSVYNDSVIIYVAPLDFIDYKSNPSIALEHLVDSIGKYLKDLHLQEEKKRKEYERKKQEELTRKEHEEQLRHLNTELTNLQKRDEELNVEIGDKTKELTDLQNEKRIIQNNICNVQTQIKSLFGKSNSIDEFKHSSEDEGFAGYDYKAQITMLYATQRYAEALCVTIDAIKNGNHIEKSMIRRLIRKIKSQIKIPESIISNQQELLDFMAKNGYTKIRCVDNTLYLGISALSLSKDNECSIIVGKKSITRSWLIGNLTFVLLVSLMVFCFGLMIENGDGYDALVYVLVTWCFLILPYVYSIFHYVFQYRRILRRIIKRIIIENSKSR